MSIPVSLTRKLKVSEMYLVFFGASCERVNFWVTQKSYLAARIEARWARECLENFKKYRLMEERIEVL